MIKKKKVIYLMIVILLLLVFYFIGNRGSEKVAPGDAIEPSPAAESAIPSTEKRGHYQDRKATINSFDIFTGREDGTPSFITTCYSWGIR